MNRLPAIALALLAPACILPAQPTRPASPWSLTVAPAVSVPLLAADGSGSTPFAAAWGGSLMAGYAPKASFPLSLRLGAGFSIAGLRSYEGVSVPGSLSEIGLLGGAGFDRDLAKGLSLRAFLDAGLAYGSLSGTNSAYAAAQAGLGLGYRISPSLAARLDLAALYKAGLYGGLGASLGLSYCLPERARAGLPAKPRLLELGAASMKSVFPVMRSYYDQSPIGSARISNSSGEPVTDIRVSFVIKQYMDGPKECATIARLEPGAAVEVPLYALFNDRILDVTEATKATGEVSVEYGAGLSQSRTATVLVNDRNALTWSDDRKAAAFVSSKDPWVLDLTGNFMAAVKGLRNPELPKSLQTAIAIHEGLRAYGIGYMLSTTRPFEQEVLNPEAVDSLKFPRQTLTFRAGDCADLSVLYASCLEAAGVETAFITIPGHIFLAMDLGIAPDESRARAMDRRNLIVRGDRVWLPIETTMRDSGFVEIWQKGADEWRSAGDKQVAAFYPMHEAWRTYPPMGLPADGSSVARPSSDKVAAAFSSEIAKAVDAELGARLAAMGQLPASGAAASSALNDRGVLYGKYGRYDEALRDFQAAAKAGSASALVNLGNISMLRSDPAGAYAFYQAAEKRLTGSAGLYVNLAKAAAAIGDGEAAGEALEKARAIDPKVADRFARLAQAGSAGTRAAEMDEGGLVWF
jgi:tetratricopeptide (TPR) repeat protein